MALLRFITLIVIIQIFTTVSIVSSFSTINLKKRYTTLLHVSLNKPSLELCDENIAIVMDEIKSELGTLFGYDAGSRGVGITGEIELVEVDGPTVYVSLSGRFWHATDTVMMRVESFIKQRIPEIINVELDIGKSKIIDDNRLNTGDSDGPKKLF